MPKTFGQSLIGPEFYSLKTGMFYTSRYNCKINLVIKKLEYQLLVLQVYKTFMEILHTFQKDQKTIKETTQHGPMCETEVWSY